MQRFVMESLDDLPGTARKLAPMVHAGVWAVEGEMGAGKTTLIAALCQVWGVTDPVSSPTFSLVNEYLRADDLPVYHFDFYRIEHEEEALDMGVEEYFDSGHICLVEWPKRIAGLLPQAQGTIHIEVVNGTRVVTITAPENA